jgi:hypothetical protein
MPASVIRKGSIRAGSTNEDAVAAYATSLDALPGGREAGPARVGASALSLSKLLLLICP